MIKIYVARAMTGRIKEDVVREALADKDFFERAGFEVLCPVSKEEVKPTKEILQASKEAMDHYWKVDKQMIFERVKELRNKYKCAFLFIYHENKGAYSRKEEGKEVTSQFMAGAKVLSEVPELIYIVDKHDSESSMIYHVKNRLGNKNSPFLVKVIDIDQAKTKIRVEAY